ncbi:MAG: hypothetical protein ACREAD_04920 [Nitrosopumilaceae archaeon]
MMSSFKKDYQITTLNVQEETKTKNDNEITYFDKNLLNEKNGIVNDSEWILVENISIRMLIVRVFADSDKQKILNLISVTPLTIPEILDHCKIPLTAGYRKINSLIKEGFIIPTGVVIAPKKKDVIKYGSVIEDVKIYMDKNSIIVTIKLKRK